jgi:hypothetical protein
MKYLIFQKILYTRINIKKLFKTNTGDTIKSMNGIDFIEQNEFHIKSRRLFGEPTTPTMIRILLRTGIAQTEKQALFILSTLTLIVLLLTCSLIYSRLNPSSSDIIIDAQGNSYTFDQYINAVRQGKDPLLPK